jgi:hypothetical protein
MQRRKTHKPQSDSERSTTDIAIDEEIQIRIGKNLKAFYEGVASEPVPDRLRAMIEELEKREARKSAGNS